MWGQKREKGQELEPGATLGPYRLESKLGEGGMGIVFRAVREPDGEVVAVKVLRRELTHDETHRRRFTHEARAAAEVRHKHVVPVLEAGEADGRTFLAVSFVEGRSLEDRIREEGPLSVEDIVTLAYQVATGLDALHEKGILHRDLKPSNVMLDTAGDALLTDFGLAKGRAYTVLTKPGQVMGTLDYLAPELIRGQQATPASDLYGLGCVLYECLSGQPPFADKNVFEVGVAHLEDDPPDPARARDDVPKGFSWALLRALEKEPNERPPSGVTYAQMLRVGAGGPRG
jgi:serine/threonine protein kinase